jgi:signal transduction histidine kinase/FixJ family two-component response regulator
MNGFAKPSVLIVDDREDKRLALDAVLCDLPITLVIAASGREALRHVLNQDFAVILLDVDMPGMDGFETAQLIRTRQSSRDTPIIFITAHEDECFRERGYSLGAVDYILQPIAPDFLRSKVSVFVDLYRKNQIVTEQTRWQLRRMDQLKRLADASVAINAAPTMLQTLQIITDTARQLIDANQAITFLLGSSDEGLPHKSRAICSFSEKYALWRTRPLDLTPIADTAVAQSSVATRLTARQLSTHPDWSIVGPLVEQQKIPPVAGMLAAPLIGRDGKNLGVIYLADAVSGEFTDEDESILIQLAQMGAVALNNILNAQAREANRAKDQFIAVLSHELRTPLTPVLALIGSLETDERLPPDIVDDLATVRRNVELEARLIDDLLDLTRISKGKIQLQIAPVDAHASIRETLRICRTEIKDKDLQVAVKLQAQHFVINADETRVQQIFWNLLKNAVKFTPQSGRIEIHTDSSNDSGDFFSLTVTDTGIGIPPDALSRIFNAFEQGHSTITRQFGGLGLGLAITKALVDGHGGRIEVTSAGVNRGATFKVTLPLSSQKPQPRQAPAAIDSKSSAAKSSQRILLVEDHPDTARVMLGLLKRAGYTVENARSVGSALELARLFQPDVVVSDIGLPDATGLELMRQLRLMQPLITGIAISGYGMEEDAAKSLEAGFSDHLTKPINPTLLLEKLHQLELRPPVAT